MVKRDIEILVSLFDGLLKEEDLMADSNTCITELRPVWARKAKSDVGYGKDDKGKAEL